MIHAHIMAIVVAAIAASVSRTPATPAHKPAPPTVPILVSSNGSVVSAPAAPAANVVTGAALPNSPKAATSSAPSTTTQLIASGSTTVTLLSSNGKSQTHTVDAQTAKSLQHLSGTNVKVTQGPNGTVAVTPLVQTVTGKITAVSGNRITVASANGTVTQIVTPAASTALHAGAAVTAVTNNGGKSVTLIPTPARNPLRNVVAGTVKAVSKTAVTIATSAGVHRVAVAPSLVPALQSRVGKTVALTTSNTRVATSLVKRSTLNTLIAAAKDPPPQSTTLVAAVTAKSGTTVSLQTADGVVHDALCGAACSSLAVAAGDSGARQAYVAIVSPADVVQQIIPLPDQSRIVGEIVSFAGDVAVIMLATGDIVELPCDCASVLPESLSAGDAVLLELDRNGKIVAAVRYPTSGVLIGTVIEISPKALTLRTADGKTVALYCSCAAANVAAGQLVAVGLNASGSVASVAPLGRGNRLTAQVLSRDGRVITIQTDPRTRFTVNVPPASMAPPEGSVVIVAFTPDSTVQSVTIQSVAGKCGRDKKRTCGGVARRGAATGPVQSVAPFLAAISSGDCQRRSGSVLTVGVANKNTGLALPHANVALDGPAPVRWVTSADGYVVFFNVPAGRYTVAITKQGYVKAQSRELRIACAQSLQLAAALTPIRMGMSSSVHATRRPVTRRKPTKCNHAGTRGPTSHWSCRL